MSLWWIAITLICLGLIGALFRRQTLLISLNIDVALVGVCVALVQCSQTWNNTTGIQIAILILGLITIHQIIIWNIASYLLKKHNALHIDDLRNLRG